MIWLIGNKGMLGTEVETLLKNRGMEYVATDLEADITDMERLREFAADRPISWIVNCSAYTAVDRAEEEPEKAFRINADGPRNIADLAKAKNAKLIHISTDYVFDGLKEGDYAEADPPNPVSVYGMSKHRGEINIAEIYHRYFIIRTAWLYGKHGPNFVATMLRLFAERKEVRVVGDQFGSPTYAPDLAAAVLAIILSGSDSFGIYHFSNEGRISWFDFAREIYRIAMEKGLVTREVALVEITTKDYPTKASRPKNACLSKEKIRSTFNIPVRTWQEALDEYLEMGSNL